MRKRRLEGINCWRAHVAGLTFRGMNEQSARNRAESYLRNTGRKDPITMEPPQ